MKKCWRDWKTDFLSKYEKIPIKLETNSNKRINKGITKKTELECLHKKRKKFFFMRLSNGSLLLYKLKKILADFYDCNFKLHKKSAEE